MERRPMGKSRSGLKEGMSTGIVKDTRYMDHWMGDYHPECPQRLKVIYDMLEEPDMAGKFQEIPPGSRTRKSCFSFMPVTTLTHLQPQQESSTRTWTLTPKPVQPLTTPRFWLPEGCARPSPRCARES